MKTESVVKTDTENIFCEHRQCTISVSGCVARQKRASHGLDWKRGAGAGSWGIRKIPFDPVCKDCEQGKVVMQELSASEKTDPGRNLKPISKPAPVIPFEPEIHEIEQGEPEQKPEQKPEIPYGYCRCGCGQKTSVSKVNDKINGYIKGEPRNYLPGHHLHRHSKPELSQPKTRATARKNAGVKSIADGLLKLSDGKALYNELIRQSVMELRDVDSQALWILAQALRGKHE